MSARLTLTEAFAAVLGTGTGLEIVETHIS